MKRLLLVSLACLGCGASTAAPTTGRVEGVATSAAEADAARDVLTRVNEERAQHGLQALAWHDGLADVAWLHSADMDARGFFSHDNPDGEGPAARVDRAGIPWTAVAENIARGAATAEEAVDGWMNSPPHRETILDPDLVECGVGVVLLHGGEGPFWTHVFRRP